MSVSSLFPPKTTHLTNFQSPPPLSFRVKAAVSVDSVKPRKSSSSSRTTLYQVLCINENASQTEIKAAYRSQAKLYHPDAASEPNVNGQDFIHIHNAYAVLSDPIARTRYDLSIGAAAIAAQQRHIYEGLTGTATMSKMRPTKRWETDQCW